MPLDPAPFSGKPLPPGPSVSPERLRECRRLFEPLGLRAGIEGYDDKEEVHFMASTRGLSISGSVKGYLFAKRPCQPLLPVLGVRLPRRGIAYRHLDGGWYLYLTAD